ncbi:Yqey-like protein-domain-containing protein [Xylariaceae sp. FL0255]|nr:Yqey-like protein-domain-containing protein [Xylariaceae sp. FL0255]
MALRSISTHLTTGLLRPSKPLRAIFFTTLPPQRRQYSSDSDLPPLLQRLKGDLKTAMRSKDAPRLQVIRNAMALVNNASKTPNPITTDAQVLSILRKLVHDGTDAAEVFRTNSRDDLMDKELGQVNVLKEYIADSGVEDLTGEQLTALIEKVVKNAKEEGQKVTMGDMMKTMLAPGGPLEGKNADKAELAAAIKRATAAV